MILFWVLAQTLSAHGPVRRQGRPELARIAGLLAAINPGGESFSRSLADSLPRTSGRIVAQILQIPQPIERLVRSG